LLRLQNAYFCCDMLIPPYYTFAMLFQIFFKVLLLLILVQRFSYAGDWKLLKDTPTLKIYNRTYQQSQFKEYKAVMTVKASLFDLLALIKNDTIAKNWISRVKEFKTLQIVSTHEWYTYAEMSLPFPFQNRDLVSHNTVTQTENHILIELQSVPNFIPEHPNKVRMKKSKGKWLFKKLSNQEVEVIYEFFSEPAIALPQWFVQPFIVQGIYDTLYKMKQIVEKR
jgi:hypothetical protein